MPTHRSWQRGLVAVANWLRGRFPARLRDRPSQIPQKSLVPGHTFHVQYRGPG